jgi:hypothetical protein
MPVHRIVKRGLPVLLLGPLCGCYSYRDVAVTVVDIHDKSPIMGARVYTEYEVGLGRTPPRTDVATTGPDGRASLRVANDPLGVGIIAWRNDYRRRGLSIYPAHTRSRAGAGKAWQSVPWPYPPQTIQLMKGVDPPISNRPAEDPYGDY